MKNNKKINTNSDKTSFRKNGGDVCANTGLDRDNQAGDKERGDVCANVGLGKDNQAESKVHGGDVCVNMGLGRDNQAGDKERGDVCANMGLDRDNQAGDKECGGGEVARQYTGFAKKIDNFFMISKRGSNFRTEFFAGIATFLAMAYILVVNPNMILGESHEKWASVFIATIFGAFTGTILMALLAKLPYAQAPGMGLNSVTGALIGGYGAYKFNFNTAMLIILLSGVIFLLLSIIPCGRNKETNKLISLREKVFDGVPKSIRTAIPVGIGLYVAFIGFQKATMVVGNPVTLTEFVGFTEWSQPEIIKNAIVCLFGLIIIAVLSSFKVKGSVILAVLGSTLLSMAIGIVDWNTLKGQGAVSWKFWENFGNYFSFGENGAFFAPFHDIDIGEGIWPFIMMIVTFSMIDMFDTMGTVVGCASKAGLIDQNGKPVGYSDIMHADSVATVCGALFGTSTVTTYVESGAGIAEGGRTGFTSVVVAGLFLLSIFLAPLFEFIPAAATAPALIFVGVHMIGSIKNIDFSDAKNAIPAFLAIVTMPFAYSITEGIGIAILSYLIIAIICYAVDMIKYAARKSHGAEKPKWEISIVTIIIALLFCVFFFVPTHFG